MFPILITNFIIQQWQDRSNHNTIKGVQKILENGANTEKVTYEHSE